LRTVIERAIITSTGPALQLPETLNAASTPPESRGEPPQFALLASVERRHISQVLAHPRGGSSAASGGLRRSWG